MEAEIQNCKWQFRIQCPLRWNQLAETDDSNVRICGVCLERVYRCTTEDEVKRHAMRGDCVAIFEGHDDETCETLGALLPDDG